MLASWRTPHDAAEMVETLRGLGFNVHITIGGDGTLKGGGAI